MFSNVQEPSKFWKFHLNVCICKLNLTEKFWHLNLTTVYCLIVVSLPPSSSSPAKLNTFLSCTDFALCDSSQLSLVEVAVVNHLDVVVCVSVTHSASTTTPAAQTTSSAAVRAKNQKTVFEMSVTSSL